MCPAGGTSRRALAREASDYFPTLPAGCHIALDRVAKDLVLDNLKRSLRLRPQDLAAELSRLGDVSLREFLSDTGLELEDIYRSPTLMGWSGLRRLARLTEEPSLDRFSRALGRMLHIDDTYRITQLQRIAAGEAPLPGRVADMIHFDLWGTKVPQVEFATKLAELHATPESCRELHDLANTLHDRIHRVTRPLQAASTTSLWLHARYSRDEACAAFGIPDPTAVQGGVRWVEAKQADIFFVTLTKTEQHYSPTTMYADRALSQDLFQWESQNSTRATGTVGQRYINHVALESTVHLFLRESKEQDGALGAPPYYAGTMRYESHIGERPMRVLWRLNNPLPADVLHSALVAAG